MNVVFDDKYNPRAPWIYYHVVNGYCHGGEYKTEAEAIAIKAELIKKYGESE
jgi:hypothetical protein